ncbi:reverse transcriptase domain-containing protein [Kiloniella majae]|uniref:reverse transcriptase domain-containing protein n=1 Tax=Kiloniella majae TaxID=1938558 RepID=UPI000A2793DF|nr:reverse transcriptase domain-containing protein [Kiloniella majae]
MGKSKNNEFSRRQLLIAFASTSIIGIMPSITSASSHIYEKENALIWLIGTLQPISLNELENTSFFPDRSWLIETINNFEEQLLINKHKRISEFYFSLTHEGHEKLPWIHAHSKDITRLSILRSSIFRSKNKVKFDRWIASAGVSPPKRTNVPVSLGAHNFARIEDEMVSSDRLFSDKNQLISFNSAQDLADSIPQNLSQSEVPLYKFAIDLGISVEFFQKFFEHRYEMYKFKKTRKQNGTLREIEIPLENLKTLQSVMAWKLSFQLKPHKTVHSFIRGRSSITNAKEHIRGDFIGKSDIRNFFPNISSSKIYTSLISSGYNRFEAKFIALFCTIQKNKRSKLPHGSPTSPILSNFVLYDADETIYQYCKARDITYTRYADDFTFSGKNYSKIQQAIKYQISALENHDFQPNHSKVKISNARDFPRVTGINISGDIFPPRNLKKRARAVFHLIETGNSSPKVRSQAAGYLGYLSQFTSFTRTATYKKWQTILERR